jgi:hypothetical protein
MVLFVLAPKHIHKSTCVSNVPTSFGKAMMLSDLFQITALCLSHQRLGVADDVYICVSSQLHMVGSRGF